MKKKSYHRFTTVLFLTLVFLVSVVVGIFLQTNKTKPIVIEKNKNISTQNDNSSKIATPTPSKPTLLKILPDKKILTTGYHTYQSFNNCGPASLSMALSYYRINVSQQTLGNELRPYQVPNGDNDDKSVTLEELAIKGEEYGFTAFHRPNGNPQIIKNFINYDIPIITRTLTTVNEDIGHYRVVKGYDDTTFEFIQDDSLQGKNLNYSYDDFDELWKTYNYEYLVLVPQDKIDIATEILGSDVNEKVAWQNAVKLSESMLLDNPNDWQARFNLSVAFFHIGDFKSSTSEFEKIENLLTFRTLWYQIEPIEAYYELGNYDRVFEITNQILNRENRAFSELYILRGKSYLELGEVEQAKNEFEKAVFYNVNLDEAKRLLSSY